MTVSRKKGRNVTAWRTERIEDGLLIIERQHVGSHWDETRLYLTIQELRDILAAVESGVLR